MATFKCNDPIYTILRNGKIISNHVKPGTAIANIIADAANVVCPPDCCISDVAVALDTFDIEVTTGTPTGLFVRATITHNEDSYSTAWATCTGLDTIDLVGLIVEVGGWFSGDDLCIEYSYDQINVIQGCCADIIAEEYIDEDTYDLNDLLRACDPGKESLYELLYQNPDGGVTVSPEGEVVIPDIPEDETVFISRKCGGCLTELVVITATNNVGLRLTYTTGNLPANDLAAWNTFFDLPANGTAFTSMATAGDEVTLFGGAGITLKAGLFRTSATLLKIEDDADCVTAIAGGKNLGALSLCPALTTVTLNGVVTVAQEGIFSNAALVNLSLDACTTIGAEAINACASVVTFDLPALTTAASGCFYGCTAATTFTLPLLTSAGDNCFRNCTSNVTFTLPELTSAGTSCFQGCAGATTFTLPLCTTIADTCFYNCTAATTIDLSACTALGTTTGDNGVFAFILGNTITITVPTALSTCDGGNPDADLVWLAANNTATINYI